jgi:hypothetical protein
MDKLSLEHFDVFAAEARVGNAMAEHAGLNQILQPECSPRSGTFPAIW